MAVRPSGSDDRREDHERRDAPWHVSTHEPKIVMGLFRIMHQADRITKTIVETTLRSNATT